jgi:hypothetical protein
MLQTIDCGSLDLFLGIKDVLILIEGQQIIRSHGNKTYRKRLIETLERRERLRDSIMNCCVSALSEGKVA